MILSVRIDNYKVYSHPVEMRLYPDEDVNRFDENIHAEAGVKVLKSVGLYGANNSGKTCFISAIQCIYYIIMDCAGPIQYNYFSQSKVTSLGISFLSNGRVFSYDFKYDSTKDDGNVAGYIYECLKETNVTSDGVRIEEEIFIRDSVNDVYRFKGNELSEEVMRNLSTDNILIYVAKNTVKGVTACKKILLDFAENLDIIDTNSVSYANTIDVLRSDSPLKDKIAELVKMADLDIEGFGYEESGDETQKMRGVRSLDSAQYDADFYKRAVHNIYTVHHGQKIPSVEIDSVGTGMIITLASYIADALQGGRTLIIDEFDSSLHFKITRALVLLFNNSLNDKGGQLIFTTHDVMLLDCERVFRPDQIWFVSKDSKSEYLYSLADLGYEDDDVLSLYDLIEKYRSGELGVVARPDFFTIFDDEEIGNLEE